MTTNIATIFDKNNILKTIAFYDSLRKHSSLYIFWFLCLDEETKAVMEKLNLPKVKLFTVSELDDTELEDTKNSRKQSEFVFTTKPAFLYFISTKLQDGDLLMFADNDIIFFQSPDFFFERMRCEHYSIAISPHRFPKKTSDAMNSRVGKYNAGLTIFIIGPTSRHCIQDWRNDCINWCYLRYEKERFGDQKYIEKWPLRYNEVYEIPDKGINLATWNIFNWKITEKNSQFFIDEDPLICYHFHRIKFYLENNHIKPVPIYVFHKKLYTLYLNKLQHALEFLLQKFNIWYFGFVKKPMIIRLWKQHLWAWFRGIRRYI